MVRSQAPCLYTEARLNLDPASSDSIITINLSPKHSTSKSFDSQDEIGFAARNLPTEASVYFTPKSSHSRSFLWRLLDSRRVLELQSVDLTQDRDYKSDPSLILRLVLPHPIREDCVSLAAADDHDILNVFAITTNNDLYTFDLRNDYFAKVGAAEDNVADWCSTFLPSSFSFRYPHRTFAASARELLVSLHDGGLLRLERKVSEHGSYWRETFFSEGGWGSTLRGLVPWKGHNTVHVGDVDLESTAAASITASPDGKHVFLVCFNHTLKAWNLTTGKLGVHTDLLGDNHRNPQKVAQYLLRPTRCSLVQVIEKEGNQEMDEYVLVTYSPKGHELKFWEIRDADDPVEGIRDLHEDVKLVPPFDDLLDTTVWTLEDFRVKVTPRGRNMELWALARSGAKCQLFMLRFSLHEHSSDLAKAWNSGWVQVDHGRVSIDALKAHPQCPARSDGQIYGRQPVSSTEAWLDFLLYPGRFSPATLETSLFVYQRSLGRAAPTSKVGFEHKTSLRERICAAVASQVVLERLSEGQMEYERYESDISAQWDMFFTAVKDLHKRREDVLSLALDKNEGSPWLVLADFVSPIRNCSEPELLMLNSDMSSEGGDYPTNDILYDALQDQFSERVATLLHASASFREVFSSYCKSCMETNLQLETLKEDSQSASVRIQAFYDHCGFAGQISDSDYNRLTEDLSNIGGFSGLDNTIFVAAIARLGQEQHGHRQTQLLTRFGAKLLVQGAQEMLEREWYALLDLLVLVIFIAVELEPDDLAEMNLDTNEVYVAIIAKLRELHVLKWLAGNVRQDIRSKDRHSKGHEEISSTTDESKGESLMAHRTLLESMFIGDWVEIRTPKEPLTVLMTYWIRAWVFGAPISDQYDAIVPHIMAYLLQHGDINLASDFLRFLPRTPWATYVKARYGLTCGDFTQAAVSFKQAAHGLATGRFFNVEEYDRVGLVAVDQRNYFNAGLSMYYQHVLSLFEKAKAQSFVADFARLALQSLDPSDDEHQEARTDILSRLFSSSLQTSRFDEAYSALMRYTNLALTKPALTSLVTTMVNQGRTSTLFTYSFASLHPSLSVDDVLASLCRKLKTVTSGPPYHKILYAYRISRDDFRGAAEVLWERLERIKAAGRKLSATTDNDEIVEAYLMLINVLASVSPEQAWILAEDVGDESAADGDVFGDGARKRAKGKRRVITVEDVRREYQRELDRVAVIESGRFALVGGGGEEMDVL